MATESEKKKKKERNPFEALVDCAVLLSAVSLSTTLGYFSAFKVPIYPNINDTVLFYVSTLVFSLLSSANTIVMLVLIIIVFFLNKFLTFKIARSQSTIVRKINITYSLIGVVTLSLLLSLISIFLNHYDLKNVIFAQFAMRVSSVLFIGILVYYIANSHANKKYILIITAISCIFNYYALRNYSGIVKKFNPIEIEKNENYTEKLIWSDSGNMVTARCLIKENQTEIILYKVNKALTLERTSQTKNPALCDSVFIAKREAMENQWSPFILLDELFSNN